MAEKVKLIELDINIESLTKNAAKSLQSIQSLEAEQKELKKSTKDLNISIAEYEKQAKAAKKANDPKSYNELRIKQQELKNSYKRQTEALSLVQTQLKSVRKEYGLGTKMIDAYAQKEERNISFIQKTNGSIDQLSTALSKNKAVYKSLSKEERENTQIGKRLLKIIQDHDKEYKELHRSMGNTNVDVGNYKTAIQDAFQTGDLFNSGLQEIVGRIPVVGGTLQKTTKSLQSYVLGQRTSAAATSGTSKSLKLFKIALISTGIGAIVVAIGTLVTAFASTQKGINAVNRVLTPLKVVIQSLWGGVQKLGITMVEAFSSPKETVKALWQTLKTQLINRITGIVDTFKFLGKTIQAAFELDFKAVKENANKLGESVTQTITGVDEFSKKVATAAKQTGQFLNEAIQRGKRIAKLQEQISKSEADFITKVAEGKEQFKAQNKIAEDQTKTLSEREAAAQKSIEILRDTNQEQRKRNALELELLTIKAKSNDTSDADKAEIAKKVAELKDANAALYESETTQQNKLNTIRKEAQSKAIAAAQKRVDAELKASKTKLDIYIAENKDKAKTLDGLLKYEQIVHDKKVSLLKEELKNKKKTKEEYDLEILNLSKDLAQRQAELTSEHASKELDIYIAKNKSKIDSETRLTDELVDEEEKRLQTIYDKRIEILEQQREDSLVSEQDYLLQKLQLQEDFLQQQKDLDNSVNEQKEEDKNLAAEAEQTDWENSMETRALHGASEFELARANMERQKKAEIAAAKKTGADVSKINAKYAAINKQINKDEQNAKIAGASAVLDGLSSLLGQETAAGKAVAVAKATMDTYKAANLALSTYPPPFGAIAAGVSIATGLVNVKKIMSTKADVPKTGGNIPKAEHGAAFNIGGKRHSAGGTKFYGEDGTAFEAEKDEMLIVLNRAASHAFAGLSELNEQHGGNAFASPQNYLAAGGLVSRGGVTNITNTNNNAPVIDYEKLGDIIAAKLSDSVSQLPYPVTLVQDIISETNAHNKIIDKATF